MEEKRIFLTNIFNTYFILVGGGGSCIVGGGEGWSLWINFTLIFLSSNSYLNQEGDSVILRAAPALGRILDLEVESGKWQNSSAL